MMQRFWRCGGAILTTSLLAACGLLLVEILRPQVADAADGTLQLALFNVNATPPMGSPLPFASTRKVEDPLFARGIVLLGAGDPIVLCSVDWIGIGNDGNLIWREKLAQAAGTTPDRVAVHVIHQHDAPLCDFRAEELLEQAGFGQSRFDSAFYRSVIESAAAAIREAIPRAIPVTHLGTGQARVEKIASNRRVMGPDGKVAIIRWSKTSDPAAIAAPEGLIDPNLKQISFWNGEHPIASLTYYATHPMSYYGNGSVTPDFVGLARARREQEIPSALHVHFNGAGGNITAGKYNDGSPQARRDLTDRMEAGMKQAWEATVREPITASDVDWHVVTVNLPVADYLDKESLMEGLHASRPEDGERGLVTPKLAWLERDQGDGVPIELSCLNLKNARVIHMPGELFIEYQLAAQKMAPDQFVCMAAYGDIAPGYIGTEISYSQGGHETSEWSTNVTAEVEQVLMEGLRQLLIP